MTTVRPGYEFDWRAGYERIRRKPSGAYFCPSDGFPALLLTVMLMSVMPDLRGGDVDDAIELADLIWKLRSELTRAMYGGENKALRFRAETVELELCVVLEKVRDPTVKVRLWVLDGSVGARRTATTTQTLRLTLHPETEEDPGRPAKISGDDEDGEV